MSINVETIGDALIVQHDVAEVKEPALCRMVSISDAINKNGRTKVKVEWMLSARKIDDQTTEYTNQIHAWATAGFIAFIKGHGITLEQAAGARQIASDAHNRDETPNFTASIERHALKRSPKGSHSLLRAASDGREKFVVIQRKGVDSRSVLLLATDLNQHCDENL